MVGYDGPIYMTQPTQAICPILLEDYRKIAVDMGGCREGTVTTVGSAQLRRQVPWIRKLGQAPGIGV